MSRDFFFRFFLETSSPKPLKITLGSFKSFGKFADIFTSQGAAPVSVTPVENFSPVSATGVANFPPVTTTTKVNFPTGTAGFIDTSGEFSAGVIATGFNDTGANSGNNIRLFTPLTELEGKNVY